MIACKTSELGYSVYECPDCGEIKFSYHTCKSRFCPSCGNKYVKKRSGAILQKCYNCKHRHIVLLFLIIFGIFLEKIENLSIYFFVLSLLPYFLGLKAILKKNIILQVFSQFSTLMVEIWNGIHTFILSLLKELWVILISLRSLILFLMMPFAKDFKKFY